MTKEKLDQLARNDGVIYVLDAPICSESTIDLTTTKLTAELGDSQTLKLAVHLTEFALANPKQGITRTTIGEATIVVTPNEVAKQVITVVVPTGHPFMKSLTRSVKRYFKSTPVRRELARPVPQPEPEPLGEPRVIGGDHVSPWPATERKAESEATQ